MTLRVPFVHPRYAAGPVLGAGAQGVVFRVTDREDEGRALVAKLWLPGVFGAEALRGEFSLLARLRIAGLVRAHDLGREEETGAPFLVEDFIDGLDARGWLAEVAGPERVRRLVRLLGEILRTLGALHEAGFLHGDLKPAHVRVPPAGRAVLLDLGAAVPGARVGPTWGEGVLALSPGFAAPELLAGGNPSPASDLYGLGALGWSIAAGTTAPAGPHRGALRERAPWVPPSVADFLESLLAVHPGDRPQGAREALARLGAATDGAGRGELREGRGGLVVGREPVIEALGAPFRSPVRYLVGPSGLGKSHLAREALTAALLAGRDARLLSFPLEDGRLIAGLLAFLRGVDGALPFGEGGRGPLFLVLDDLHRAPPEVAAALDGYRCRDRRPARATVLATAREAPEGADHLRLDPVSDEALAQLCRGLGESDEQAIEAQVRAAGGNPGWLLSSLGRVPLTEDAVTTRLSSVSPPARGILAAAATLGGELAERWALALGDEAKTSLAELLTAGLLGRRAAPGGVIYAMASPQLAAEVRPAVAALAPVRALAALLLADPQAPARVLLALAQAPDAAEKRPDLLRAAADRARREGLTSEESEALLGLCQDASHRSPDALRRLERLTRDTGQSAAHTEVLGWLDQAADADPRLRPLSLRRRAEKLAREGEGEQAAGLAASALAAARAQGDTVAEAFALATVGLVALFRASWTSALDALREARRLLILQPAPDDPEEIARLEHNLGVVASYRGLAAEAIGAFERSLAAKQSLGDRAGMRASLRNLGYALAQGGRFDEAARALDEALALARSLGQAAGRAWCLSARAEVEVRRGATREAERFIAEASALGEALPAAVRVDLCILRAEVFVIEGDGPAALAQLRDLTPDERADDPLADARALVIEARAHLASLPAVPRQAARAAIAAIRRARAGELPEPEAQALAVLRQARPRRGPGLPLLDPDATGLPARAGQAHDASMDSDHSAALWAWLERVGEGQAIEACAVELALLILGQSGAERAFVVIASPAAEIRSAWAVDLDGLALGDAARRVPADILQASLTRATPIYQRSVPTVGGQGSRLAVASAAGPAGHVVLIVEHRQVPGRFDTLDEPRVLRWRSLAALLGRLAADARPAAPVAASPTTSPASAPAPAAAPSAPGPARSDPEPPRRRAPIPDVTTIQPAGESRRQFPAILGASEPLRRALARLDLAIDSELPVLIVGETGVGKELFARAVHDQGARSQAPFVAVNCAAIPDSLFEAELFGHARGSFTGADRARPGLIARAEGGTLFLDEIGELKPARQASLLRVLESRLYRPVGSDEERPARVRVVAATNVDLERAVEAGAFRQDLLFRLNVLRIRVPPLRERPEDVTLLAHHFLAHAGAAPSFSPAALAALHAHGWPGNVRELEHQMQRLAVLRLARIELAHLPREIRAAAPAAVTPLRSPPDERDEVTRALDASGGNISHAAKLLGLTRQGLKKRMVRLGLRERSEAKSTPS